MKQSGYIKWLSVFLISVLLFSFSGCISQQDMKSGSADNPSVRHAELISARSFKSTFYPRGDVRDNSVVSGSTEEERVALLASGIDGKANIINYIDVTGDVDLDDMEKDDFINEYRKKLNESSTTYQYTSMERMDHGDNFCQYLVAIKSRSADEDQDLSSDQEDQESQANEEKKPMVFLFVKDGKKTYEVIGLDMEAEDSSAFSDSFQEILNEIVTIKTVSAK